MRAPQTTALAGLPDRVTVYEVGARDGLQNESEVVPVEVKAELVRRLVASGLRAVELTSFVHPRWVPQLADAEQLLDLLGPLSTGELAGVRAPVLVPNRRGLERALARDVPELAVFVSATESFARKNLNASRDEALTMSADVVDGALAAGRSVRGYVSMCFGDPWEGDVDPAAVVDVVVALREQGCHEISLGDTIGVATPGQVVQLLAALDTAGVPREQLAVHFHDTYGQALSNTLVALQQGITTVDASAGGLGGCPFAMSATGNLATEDLVWQLHGLGIATGVDLEALVATSGWLAALMGRPSPSNAVRALG
ncbi:hydroxymethylglutaryl-CoA lyase [Angustibacter sp. McL0619]|uniref:hydroxymethylglutaryl-CoA lyase n=1 Tax=Angustibacter sp. McL0619 TaxID=3415676 RepID=UPI003CF7B9AA